MNFPELSNQLILLFLIANIIIGIGCIFFAVKTLKTKNLSILDHSFFKITNDPCNLFTKIAEFLLFFFPAYNFIFLLSLMFNFSLLMKEKKEKFLLIKAEKEKFQREMRNIEKQQQEKLII